MYCMWEGVHWLPLRNKTCMCIKFREDSYKFCWTYEYGPEQDSFVSREAIALSDFCENKIFRST